MDLLIADTDGRDRWLNGVAHDMLADIQMSFGESPSAPGEPPGVDTGTLRASMRVEKQRPLVYHIMDGTNYGLYLEWGTTQMAPRPFVRPVFDNWRRKKILAAAKRGLIDV
jgi:HK97 gp10 family phage protein